jgi:hypothetical protein
MLALPHRFVSRAVHPTTRHREEQRHRTTGTLPQPVENARALLHIRSYQQQGMSYDAAVKTTAAAELSSPSTLRAVSHQFAATGALTPPRSPVDCSHPLHPFYLGESGPPFAAQLLIHHLLHQVTLENTYESCNTLPTALAAELGIVVSRWTVCRWLHSLGYVYRKKHFVNSDPSYRWSLIRRYIYQYAAALQEQEQGTAIIVYMDESYIHSHHCSKRLWHSLSLATKNEVRGDCKGKRIIIIHAMTKDGLLEVEGTELLCVLQVRFFFFDLFNLSFLFYMYAHYFYSSRVVVCTKVEAVFVVHFKSTAPGQ